MPYFVVLIQQGRDYFDLLWFIGNRIVPNYAFLSQAYSQTQNHEVTFDHDILKEKLIDRVRSVNFSKVLADVAPFLIEKDTLRYFSPESFIGIFDSWQLLDQKGYL